MKMNVLDERQIEEFKLKTEYLLENVGFRVLHKGILMQAAKVGAKIDTAKGIICLPAPLLRELISLVPSSYRISTVDGGEYEIGSGKQYATAIVTDPWIIDYHTMMPRRPCLEDMRKHTILAQKLDNVAAVSRMDFQVTDYNDATSSLRALECHLLNHAKHNAVYAASIESFWQWMEIGNILAGSGKLAGSGLLSVAVAIVSPMTLTDINAELLLGTVANGLPVIPTICPMAGTTSPYSLDATLLQGNAENIFLAALTQIVNPGNPFLYAFGPSRSDMRSGYDMYYTLDKVLWKKASVELAKSYGLPVATECGGSMACRYDPQLGAEGILFMLAAQNSGADLLCGLGSCYNAVGMSAEMILIQMEWLRAARFLSKGISTVELSKGVESIERAGHGGNFLTDDLTIELLRSDAFFNRGLLDYSGDANSALSLLENAHSEVDELVVGFRSPVPESVQNELRRYFEGLYKKAGCVK